ncbi:hypothetical protein [Paenibacillus sp. P46E]|uniref:hypothetical protein n=1 Tax=Paenibacillus sp. P46E TaxID=1349436 RepID=UPI00093A2036|nr:hypothetical protein [Paenibacillus sp. P46E]OKP97977.1 hypothetical protein A3849_13030 [Paenibacillus sp. P46E]
MALFFRKAGDVILTHDGVKQWHGAAKSVSGQELSLIAEIGQDSVLLLNTKIEVDHLVGRPLITSNMQSGTSDLQRQRRSNVRIKRRFSVQRWSVQPFGIILIL